MRGTKRLMAFIAASRLSAERSAPLKPLVSDASAARSTLFSGSKFFEKHDDLREELLRVLSIRISIRRVCGVEFDDPIYARDPAYAQRLLDCCRRPLIQTPRKRCDVRDSE
jgi:hypothetical protein